MTDETPKPIKMGRPVEFKEEYCDLIRAFRGAGYSESKFCSIVGISRDSFYRWKHKYPEFKEACDISEEDSKYYYEKLGKKGMMGKIKGFKPQVYEALVNRQHGSLKTVESGKTEINIGSMNVLSQLSTPDLLKKLETRMENLKLIKGSDGQEGTDGNRAEG